VSRLGEGMVKRAMPAPAFSARSAGERQPVPDRPRKASEETPQLCDRYRAQLGSLLALRVEILPRHRRETVKRVVGHDVWNGKKRPSTARVVTAVVLMALDQRDLAHDPDGSFVLNVAQLAREVGYSRPTVYKALRWLVSPAYDGAAKLYRVAESSTGPRRPGLWALRPDLWVGKNEHNYGPSAASVKPYRNTEGQNHEQTRRGALVNEVSSRNVSCAPRKADPSQRTRWLDSPYVDLNRLPSHQEVRGLAGVIRDLLPEWVATPLLNAIIWRSKRSATLGIWWSVVKAAAEGKIRTSPTTEVDQVWRSRGALRALVGGDPDWIAILNSGPPRTRELVERELAKIERRIAGAEAKLEEMIASAKRGEEFCVCCGKPVRVAGPPSYERWRRELPDAWVFLRRGIPPKTPFLYDNYVTKFIGSPARAHMGPHFCHARLYVTRYFLERGRERLRRELDALLNSPTGEVPRSPCSLPPSAAEAQTARDGAAPPRNEARTLSTGELAVLRAMRRSNLPTSARSIAVRANLDEVWTHEVYLRSLRESGLVEVTPRRPGRASRWQLTGVGREAAGGDDAAPCAALADGPRTPGSRRRVQKEDKTALVGSGCGRG